MALEGTVVNGVIVLQGTPLPEGQKVYVNLADEFSSEDELDPPGSFDSPEQILEALRESFEDKKAGRTRPFRVALDEILANNQLPSLPRE